AAIEGRSGVLLANHGAVTYGPSIEVAYDRHARIIVAVEPQRRAAPAQPAPAVPAPSGPASPGGSRDRPGVG
ncbi:MAG TPA: hypothetical protein VG499_02990, partial [Actinomycetota bacterium]|nr:hypothetical protein [Actinomycetota bacterium]